MNKSLVMLFVIIFSTVGAYVPLLFGDTNILSGWSILGGTLGGFFGIWFAVWLNKQMS